MCTWTSEDAAEQQASAKLVHLAATWVIAYMERHRKRRPPDVTEATLEIVRKTTCDFVDALKDSIAPVMGSGGDTMKLHRLAHVPQQLRQKGHLKHYSSNHFEHEHTVIKRSSQQTAKRKATLERDMVTRIRVMSIMQMEAKEVVRKTNDTTYMSAHKTGLSSAPKSSTSMRWSAFSADRASAEPVAAETAAASRMQVQPEVLHLPVRLQEWWAMPEQAQIRLLHNGIPPNIHVVFSHGFGWPCAMAGRH